MSSFFNSKIRNCHEITLKIFYDHTMINAIAHTFRSLSDIAKCQTTSLIFVYLYVFYFVSIFCCSLFETDNYVLAKLSLCFMFSIVQPFNWLLRVKEVRHGTRWRVQNLPLSSTVTRSPVSMHDHLQDTSRLI